MNSSQPPISSSSGGGGMVTIIIVIVLLIAMGVGGYFGYTKWWVPKQCVGQSATSSVATFVYDSDSSNCLANTCMTGFGCDSSATPCTSGDPCPKYAATPQYTLFSNTVSTHFDGKCGGTSPVPVTTGITKQMDCETACNGCVGYDWDGSTGCNTYSKPLVTPITSDTNYKCYQPPS